MYNENQDETNNSKSESGWRHLENGKQDEQGRGLPVTEIQPWCLLALIVML